MSEVKTAEFRFSHRGVIPRLASDLLGDGAYRYLSNVTSVQEGSLASKRGVKLIGALTDDEASAYVIRKLCVSPEADPMTPSVNPRYLGIVTAGGSRDIHRTTTYGASTAVATGVDTDASRHWEMAPYSAGSTGNRWAYFACPNGMYKDSASNPQAPLPRWGVPPAVGVAKAAKVLGSVNITAITNTTPAQIGLASAVGLADFDQVTIDGVVGLAGPYWVRIGIPDKDNQTIEEDTKFRIYDENGQGVPGVEGYVGGGSIANVPVSGNLDGGSESSPNDSQTYDYRYVLVDPVTNNEGNPSQTMLSASGVAGGTPIAARENQVTVTVWGHPLAALYTKTAIYRRGGTLWDAWRLVGYVDTPANASTSTTFVDNVADDDLQYAKMLETDNDPPVTSSLTDPLKTTLAGPVGPGRVTISVPAAFITALNVGAATGTLAHIYGRAAIDDCIIESVNAGGGTITLYMQLAHVAGDTLEINAITGRPCHLVAAVGEALLVAGDSNNPDQLYKSKNGRPESFPVGTDAAGAITQLRVGNPANGIVNLTEFRGQALCMNVSGLFEVAVVNGSLMMPAEVAPKGLAAQDAWCKSETEVWFLSTDGIYSWDGGSLRHRSGAIDSLFRGEQVNGMVPLARTAVALRAVRMEAHRGEIRLIYLATDGTTQQIVCEPAFEDRWTPRTDGCSGAAITAMLDEPDTHSLVVASTSGGAAVFGIADAVHLSGGVNYTSDWYTDSPLGNMGACGSVIAYSIKLPWFDLGQPAVKKLFEEAWLDVDPQLYAGGQYAYTPTLQVEVLLDYSDTPVDTITVAIPSGNSLTGRRLVGLLTNMANYGGAPGPLTSYGREAKAISFRISGTAFPVQPVFYRLVFQYQETGVLTGGGATGWMNLGHGYDKRLYTMTIEFDTEGVNRTVVLDTVTGIGGSTVNPAVQAFTLSNPVTLGSGRALCTFELNDGIIAKLVRVRPISTATGTAQAAVGAPATAFFKIHSVDFQKEDYPADTVLFTPWRDAQSPTDKNPGWFSIDADTNNVAAAVVLANESGQVSAVSHTGTASNRKRTYPIVADQFGKMWRLTSTKGNGGKFQLFDWNFGRWHPYDEGGGEEPPEVVLWTPWNDFGYPYDKLGRNLILVVDTLGAQVQVYLQTEAGTVQTVNVTATNTARRVTIPLNSNLIGKSWRLLVPFLPTRFKLWNWNLDHIKEPPAVTSWNSYELTFGYPGFKFLKQGWFEYLCASEVTVTFVSDSGTLAITLPAHSTRKVERYLFPAVWGEGLNKSKTYRMSWSAASPVKMYPDGSCLQWLALGVDRAQAYHTTQLSEFMSFGV